MLKAKENTYPFTIQSYHSDRNANLSLHHLFLFLQECAWANAEENNFGFDFVEKNNAIWVISRLHLKLTEVPSWEEEIRIRTWPKSYRGLFAMRDFEIFSGEHKIGSVVSHWLVLDKTTKRPRRLSDFQAFELEFLNENSMESDLAKLKSSQESERVDKRKVYWSDLDVNGHVNNASYVRWIIDAVYAINQKQIMEIEINFLNELHLNQEFEIYLSSNKEMLFVELKDMNHRSICMACLK